MGNSSDILRYDEKAIMRLRALYKQFGYTQYRMSRFEEYGLYSDNKAFLASSEIITFMGSGGKLMALRPDVTLSIVKNTSDSQGMRKLYYNENVYRPDGHDFKERMQVGLECIGDIDTYTVGEVIMLAGRSLSALGERSCLDISHMGYISGLLKSAELTVEQKAELLLRIREKNVPEINSICAKRGHPDDFRERITALAALYKPYGEALIDLRRISVNEETEAALGELEDIRDVIGRFGAGQGVNIDFSIVNDLNYYNGIIFQGCIEGIPTNILSGGRYDRILQRYGKKSGAIGFAVYLDLLEPTAPQRNAPEFDVLLLYGDKTDASALAGEVHSLTAEGRSVRVQREKPENMKYKRLMTM